ncbi:ABC transporter ATP-binding protein [Actinoplanes sp. NPDC051343]|uniref:ABC transporter ATP-binding protein n=1 Tax=Actinoplanes sp. NPDC051343 TaxID=3363906 RepID=UPI003795F5C7
MRSLREQRRWIALSTVFIALWQAGEVAVPVLIGVVIDRARHGGLVPWLALLANVYIGLSYSFRYGERFGERASEQAAHSLRLRVTRRALDDRGGAESLPGALVSIATSDAARVGAVAVALSSGVAALVALVLAAAFLLGISVPLGLLVLLGTPPLLWLTHRLGGPLEERSEEEQEHAAQASGIAADLVAGLRVVKGLRAEDAAVSRYRRRSRAALRATVRSARAEAAYQGVVATLSGFFLAVVAVVGGLLALHGHLSVGQLVSSVGLAQFLVGPMSTFGWVGSDLAQGRASARRIAAVLQAPPAVTGGDSAPAFPVVGQISVRDVTASPLQELTLEVAGGSMVGIVTPDPASARELVRLLGRAHDPSSGSLHLDGIPLTSLAPDALRAAILAVDHHTELFAGPLRDGIPDAALAAAAADEVARALPDGLGTVLDDGARTLSGGQRQRVALARALASDAPVLVLHDPTTAVDTVTEARIASGLRDLRAGRTTVLVTTSPALLAVTDRVIVLGSGAVRAEGTHTDLIATDPAYRETVLS